MINRKQEGTIELEKIREEFWLRTVETIEMCTSTRPWARSKGLLGLPTGVEVVLPSMSRTNTFASGPEGTSLGYSKCERNYG